MSLHPELFAACLHKAQSVMCLTADTCDCRSRGWEFDPGLVPYFHEIISTAILLPSADSRRVVVSYKRKYRSTSLSQSSREWRNYFELSEVRHKQNVTSLQYDVHVQFLQDILLQYNCSYWKPNRKKTKEIHFSLFYFHFNYVVDHSDASALGR